MLASGRKTWSLGERVRVYRTKNGSGAVAPELDGDEGDEDNGNQPVDPRDYDVDHYERLLRDTFTTRLVRALRPDDFAEVFSDPDQLTLFPPSFSTMRTILTTLETATSPSSAPSADDAEDADEEPDSNFDDVWR
jgi:hypothetical protein